MNNPQQLINELIEGKSPEASNEEKKKLQLELDHKDWLQHPVTQLKINELFKAKNAIDNALCVYALTPEKTDSEVRVMAIRLADVTGLLKQLTTT